MIGGGSHPTPGEISLAHHGVLFLDEIPEFPRQTLEALRQPLEDKKISISRAGAKTTFPADFMLVATKNPCPCGFYGDPAHECTCSQSQILAYEKRVSGPLLDRIDMSIKVSRVPQSELAKNTGPSGKTSAEYRAEITRAREKAVARAGKPNASLSSKEAVKFADMTDAATKLLESAAENLELSARSYFKIIRVARTIADLTDAERVSEREISEALQYR
jgi:magnesium chelatase family protein